MVLDSKGTSREYPATLSKFDLFFCYIDIFFCRTRHSNNGGQKWTGILYSILFVSLISNSLKPELPPAAIVTFSQKHQHIEPSLGILTFCRNLRPHMKQTPSCCSCIKAVCTSGLRSLQKRLPQTKRPKLILKTGRTTSGIHIPKIQRLCCDIRRAGGPVRATKLDKSPPC